jgi:hypothetical protein
MRSLILLAAALVTSPALAAQDDYPPGLFENSPLVPSGPPGATVPSGSPDATAPPEQPDATARFGPPNVVDRPDFDCSDLVLRTFRSLAEVRRAHARCDPVRNAAPLWPPTDE